MKLVFVKMFNPPTAGVLQPILATQATAVDNVQLAARMLHVAPRFRQPSATLRHPIRKGTPDLSLGYPDATVYVARPVRNPDRS